MKVTSIKIIDFILISITFDFMNLKIFIIIIIFIISCKQDIFIDKNFIYNVISGQSSSTSKLTQKKLLMGQDRYSNEIFVPPLASSDFLSINKKDKSKENSIFDNIPLMIASATAVSRFDLIEKADSFAKERAKLQAQIDKARRADILYQENLQKLKLFTSSDIKSLDGISGDANKTPSRTPNPSFFNKTATITGPIKGLKDFKIELLTDFGTNGIARDDSSGSYIYVVKVYKEKAAVFVTVSYNLFNQDVKDLADLKNIAQDNIKAIDGLTVPSTKMPSQVSGVPNFSSNSIRVGSVDNVKVTLDSSSILKNDDTGEYSYLVTLKKNSIVWNLVIKYTMVSKKEYYGELLSAFTEDDFKNNDGVSPASNKYPSSLSDPTFSFSTPYNFANPTTSTNLGNITQISSFTTKTSDITKDNNAGVYFYRVEVEKSGVSKSFYITYRNLKSSLSVIKENKALVDSVTASDIKNVDGISVVASTLPSKIGSPSFSNLSNGVRLQLASSYIEKDDIDGELSYYVLAKKGNAVSNPIKVLYSGFKKISLKLKLNNGLLSLKGLTTSYTPSEIDLYKVVSSTPQTLIKKYNLFLTSFYQEDSTRFYKLSLPKMESIPSTLSFSRPFWNISNQIEVTANLKLGGSSSKTLRTDNIQIGADFIYKPEEVQSGSLTANQFFGSIVELSPSKKYMAITSKKQNTPIRIYKKVSSKWKLFDTIPVPSCSNCSSSQSIWKINSVKIVTENASDTGKVFLVLGNIYASHDVKKAASSGSLSRSGRYDDFTVTHSTDMNNANTFDSSKSKKGEYRIYESNGGSIFKLRSIYSPSAIAANSMFGWALDAFYFQSSLVLTASSPFAASDKGRIYTMYSAFSSREGAYVKYVEGVNAGDRLGWSLSSISSKNTSSSGLDARIFGFTSFANSSSIQTGQTTIYKIDLDETKSLYTVFIDPSYSLPVTKKVINVPSPINKLSPSAADRLNPKYGIVSDASNDGKIAIGFPNSEKVLVIEGGINGTQKVFSGVLAGSNNTRNFGYSLNLQGDKLLIGAPAESETGNGYFPKTNDSQSLNSGAVYIIKKNTPNWTREAYLKPINNQSNMNFGSVVRWAGTDTAIISSPNYNNVGIVQEY